MLPEQPTTESKSDVYSNAVSWGLEELEKALTIQETRRSLWMKWLRLYEATPATRSKTFPWPGCSNIVVGIVPEFVDSVVARIMQAVFSNKPLWTGEQLNRKYSAVVDPLVRYLDWCRQHMWDQYQQTKLGVLEMCKLGTAVWYNGWVDIPLFKMSADKSTVVPDGHKRGPDPKWVPLEDFLICPGFTEIASAPWVAQRVWYSKEQVQKLIKSGFLDPVDDFQKLMDTDERIRNVDPSSSSVGRDVEPDNLIAFWQMWFSADLDGDEFPEEHIMWLHRGTQRKMRAEPNPYIRGLRPFIKCAFIEREGAFEGIGIGESCEQYQEEISTIHNQRGDSRTLANANMVAARRGSGLTNDETLYPGKILFVTDPKADIVPFSLGAPGAPLSQSDEQITLQLAARRVGVNDVNQGQITPPIGRATATTVMSQLQEGTRRFDLNTSELRKALSTQALQICELFQSHGLPEPGDANSPEAVLDLEEAAQVRAILGGDDRVEGIIALSLNVATAAANKEIEKQSSIQLMQLITQYYMQVMQLLPTLFNPQVAQMMPQMQQMIMKMLMGSDKLMKVVLQAHQRFDLEDVLLMEGGPGDAGDGNPLGAAQAVGGAQGGDQGFGAQLAGLGNIPGM